jgi:DNA primase catalytic core
MPRIPDAEIERLKTQVEVRGLVEGSGVELRRAGKDWQGRCPFHADDTASLVVSPGKNLWHCFGCQVGGGPIDWVMRKEGLNFREAVQRLGSESGAASSSSVAQTPTTRKPPPPVALDAGEQELLGQVIEYYHQTLLASPEALAYLERRGIADPELIAAHRLGYANRTLGLRLPVTQLKAGAEVRGRLQRIGILRQSGHEHFNGSLVVPVFDEAGQVVEVYGRKLLDNLRAGTNKHLYLPGPHQGVWNARALVGQTEVILTEALIDAMTFWVAGHRNVTAAYGVEGLTQEHIECFKRCGVPRVLIAYDRDEAGERGAAKAAQRLMGEGLACYRVQFPKSMDANAYALKVTPAAQSLGLLIRKAQWMGQGVAPDEGPGLHVQTAPTPPAQIPSPSAAQAAPAQPAEPSIQSSGEAKADELIVHYGDRRWRVRGLAKNLSPEVLKLNVLVTQLPPSGEAFHVDSFDLYAAKARAHFVTQAAKELAQREDVIKLDLGKLLLKLEGLQSARIQAALKVQPQAPQLSQEEEAQALALLRAPDLLTRIQSDFDACGLVGEGTNKLVAYLAATSRKLAGPLAIVVQSSSAAGKSSLMDAVLAFMPEEERIKVSAMTGQSLFYMGQTNLKHKILAICEEEGASRASYALKLLQSDGELSIASTAKDATTGNLTTQQYRVEGPVMIFLTTTAIEIDEELLNRCLVLTVDEGRAQTEAIHRLQRAKRTLAGLQAKQAKTSLLALHQNAQRLLRPLAVVNPYADRLTFLSDKTRTRRDHEKYLTLIDTLALLHQHQRPVREHQGLAYIEVTQEDIARANSLAHEVLGRSLDELPPQTRRLLALLAEHVRAQVQAQGVPQAEVRFTRKDVRALTGWGDTQLKVHLARLVELEYLLSHRAQRGQGLVYELLFDGDAAQGVHLSGLIGMEALDALLDAPQYDAQRSGSMAQPSASGRGAVGQRSGGGQAAEWLATPMPARLLDAEPDDEPQSHGKQLNGKAPSYLHPSVAGSVACSVASSAAGVQA